MKKNITPIIGMFLGFALIIWSISSGGDITNFFDPPSLVITLLGSLSALFIIFPFEHMKEAFLVTQVILRQPREDRQSLVKLFYDLSQKARVNGVLALEDDLEEIDDEFIRMGLQMVVDGIEEDAVRDILELRMATIERRHRSYQQVFAQWGDLAPAFGMLGTLIGLVLMLTDLDDPSAIGVGMATALLTTFYGSLFANVLFLPIAANLGIHTEEEMFTRDMAIEGIMGIQAGTNPRILEEKLMNYLSPAERLVMKEAQGDEDNE